MLRSGGKLAVCFRRSGPTASDAFPSSVCRFSSDEQVADLLRGTGFVEVVVDGVTSDGDLAIAIATAGR
jgi:hypothetical protein